MIQVQPVIAFLAGCLLGAFPQEGPLGSAAFQHTDKAAQTAIAEGDALMARVREDDGLNRAFDAWHRALLVSSKGAAVSAQGSGLSEEQSTRTTFGVEEAVLRRIDALSTTQRLLWAERFETLGAKALTSLPGSQPSNVLERIERTHPGTQAAARGALILGDRAAEEGALATARLWWKRAGRHSRLSTPHGAQNKLQSAVQRRHGSLAGQDPGRQQTLLGARKLKAVRQDRLENFAVAAHSLNRVPLGRGLRLGAVELSDGSALVQGPRIALFYEPRSLDGMGRPERILLKDWSLPGSAELRPVAAPTAGGWSLLPASDGERVVLVIDRGEPGRTIRGLARPARGNALAMVRRNPSNRPSLVWARRGLKWEGPGATDDGPNLRAVLEFQPGPLIVGNQLFVLARSMGSAADGNFQDGDLSLISFDLASGRLLRSLLITQSSDLTRESRLLGYSPELRTVAMPLALVGETILCGTNAGLVAAVQLDGRLLWTLRTRRRHPDAPGWPGSRPPLSTPTGVWLAPGDSDRLYRLNPRPGTPPLLTPILHLGQSLDLAGSSQSGLLLMGRSGAREALIEVGLDGGSGESDGILEPLLHLGPAERFTGTPLHSTDRTLLATNHRLYLFDRSREMLLLDAPALLGQDLGGDLVGLREHILLLGANTVRVLRVLP